MDLTYEAITEFAVHLIPEAFTASTSASRVEIRPPARMERAGEWLSSCLRDAIAARDLAGDDIPGVIYVSDDERWRWDLPLAGDGHRGESPSRARDGRRHAGQPVPQQQGEVTGYAETVETGHSAHASTP